MNQVLLITGGSDGIGKSLCFEYGKRGYSVIFSGRDPLKIKSVSQSLDELQIPNAGFQLDASKEEDNQQLVHHAITQFGRIDVVICNAGLSMRALFKDLSLEAFDHIMKVNFHGVVSLVKCALPHLIESKGSLIGVSSVNGRRGTPARTAYVASKYALEGFFESLRMEVKREGVHVLVVCPGFTKTNIRVSAIMDNGQPQGENKLTGSGMMTPEVVARKVYQAMISKKRDLVLTRLGKWAIRINKFFPRLMDRIVFKVMSKKPDSPYYQN